VSAAWAVPLPEEAYLPEACLLAVAALRPSVWESAHLLQAEAWFPAAYLSEAAEANLPWAEDFRQRLEAEARAPTRNEASNLESIRPKSGAWAPPAEAAIRAATRWDAPDESREAGQVRRQLLAEDHRARWDASERRAAAAAEATHREETLDHHQQLEVDRRPEAAEATHREETLDRRPLRADLREGATHREEALGIQGNHQEVDSNPEASRAAEARSPEETLDHRPQLEADHPWVAAEATHREETLDHHQQPEADHPEAVEARLPAGRSDHRPQLEVDRPWVAAVARSQEETLDHHQQPEVDLQERWDAQDDPEGARCPEAAQAA
jgi:hypothetical protein